MSFIKPISDLCNTNEISDLCHTQQEPIFITKNGYRDLVMESIATYEKQLAQHEIYQKLDEAEQQVAEGIPNIGGKEVFDRLRQKYG